jgi:ribosomal protein S18 acetylase RimI-like enzyme
MRLHHQAIEEKGGKKLFVNTSSSWFYNNALRFYKKNGFKKEAVIKDYYWSGEDQRILSKNP